MGMSNQTEEKELFHAVSLSGGKDSTAMLLLMIERGLPIDAVLTADTGMEFPEMYEHLQKLDDYLFAERGLHLTWLRHPKGFEWLMFEEKKQRPASIENRQRLGVSLYGNGWPGPRVRWCTGQLKTHLIHKEINRLKGQYKAVSYVGIAADEPKRIKNERYPLMDWGITEKEALRICYDRGYDFGGLYQIYRRCSCWCCPLQGIGELRKLRQHHPELRCCPQRPSSWSRTSTITTPTGASTRRRIGTTPESRGRYGNIWTTTCRKRSGRSRENDRRAYGTQISGDHRGLPAGAGRTGPWGQMDGVPALRLPEL